MDSSIIDIITLLCLNNTVNTKVYNNVMFIPSDLHQDFNNYCESLSSLKSEILMPSNAK